MSEVSFEQMLEESLKTIRTGEVVEGTVIGVKEDEIILNIGYKSDGIISRSEYTNEPNADLTKMVSVGDTMEAKVLKVRYEDTTVVDAVCTPKTLGRVRLYVYPPLEEEKEEWER